jgi:dimethylargininase
VVAKSLAAPFVSSDAAPLGSAVVLRPSTAVDRLAPRSGEPSPIADRAAEQHTILIATLRDRGVDVHVLEPRTQTPAESLVADTALLLPNGAVIARPAHVDRRADVATIEQFLGELGIPIIGRIEAPGLLDGTDVALAGGRAFVGVTRPGAGLHPRSNALGRQQFEAIAAQQGFATVELAVAPDVVHLRDVFSVVAADTIIAAPDKVDLVPATGLTVVEVPRGEELAAGVLAIGERRVLVNLRFRESIAFLRKAKIAVEAIDLWEFGKAGFGPPSLVLALKRG